MIVVKNIEEQMNILSDYRNMTRLKYGEQGLQKSDYNAFGKGQYTYSRINDSKEELNDFDYQAILATAIVYALKSNIVNQHQPKDLLAYSIDLLIQETTYLSKEELTKFFLEATGVLTITLDTFMLASEATRRKVLAAYEHKPSTPKIAWINSVETMFHQRNDQR